MPFPQLEKRLRRTQPSAPVWSTGGASCLRSGVVDAGISVMVYRSLSAICLLYQFMNSEIDRLTVR